MYDTIIETHTPYDHACSQCIDDLYHTAYLALVDADAAEKLVTEICVAGVHKYDHLEDEAEIRCRLTSDLYHRLKRRLWFFTPNKDVLPEQLQVLTKQERLIVAMRFSSGLSVAESGCILDLKPTKCNLCGGHVIYTSYTVVYRREYGSRYCYYCTSCGAFVGTHKPHPDTALGILADERMRQAKVKCHEMFDIHWRNKDGNEKAYRTALYCWLAKKLKLPVEECHFGYFDLDMLERAYVILDSVKDKEMSLNSRGKARFCDGELAE